MNKAILQKYYITHLGIVAIFVQSPSFFTDSKVMGELTDSLISRFQVSNFYLASLFTQKTKGKQDLSSRAGIAEISGLAKLTVWWKRWTCSRTMGRIEYRKGKEASYTFCSGSAKRIGWFFTVQMDNDSKHTMKANPRVKQSTQPSMFLHLLKTKLKAEGKATITFEPVKMEELCKNVLNA